MDDLLNSVDGLGTPPITKRVKGELHATLDPVKIDPNDLIASCPMLTPFERREWFERIVRYDRDASQPLVGHAWRGNSHCWLFLMRSGKKLAALANWYSFAFRPVCIGGNEMELLKALARLLSTSPSIPAEIILSPVPQANGVSDRVALAFAGAGWIVFREPRYLSWKAHVGGKSFDQYWAERPGQVRSTVKRKAKKFGIATEVHTSFDPALWAEYQHIYDQSWKEAEGSPAFLKDMAEHKAALGQLRIGIARHQGKAVAAQLWVVAGGVAYIHKLAHLESAVETSAGTILTAALCEHVIDVNGVDIIDFGTGNDAYKRDWMDEADTLDSIEMFRKTSLFGLYRAGRSWLSRLIRGHQAVAA